MVDLTGPGAVHGFVVFFSNDQKRPPRGHSDLLVPFMDFREPFEPSGPTTTLRPHREAVVSPDPRTKAFAGAGHRTGTS